MRYRQQWTGRPGPIQVTLLATEQAELGRPTLAGNIVRRSFAFDFFGRALNGRALDGNGRQRQRGAAAVE